MPKSEQKAERGEKPERRERKGGKSRAKSVKESGGYEDDEEALEYNPFAEAFKDADWNK